MKETTKQYSRDFLEQAHNGCSSHKNEILSSRLCGCFYCEQTFLPSEIVEWIDESSAEGESAICPKCGIDSVLSSKYPIDDKQFLHEMNKLWF
jgi:hypothetical protein